MGGFCLVGDLAEKYWCLVADLQKASSTGSADSPLNLPGFLPHFELCPVDVNYHVNII